MGKRGRSFGVLASFRLSYRVIQTCSFAKASPKLKNPRSAWLQFFFKRSNARKNPQAKTSTASTDGGRQEYIGSDRRELRAAGKSNPPAVPVFFRHGGRGLAKAKLSFSW